MNVGTIEGGTHAGWRVVRPTPPSWVCNCRDVETGAHRGRAALRPGYLGSCPECKAKRPK